VIRAWVADASGAREAAAAEACAVATTPVAGRGVWIDLECEDEASTRRAIEPLDVHPLVLDDIAKQVTPPKVDDYGDYLYLVVHSARWEEAEARPSIKEIDVVLGAHWIVTAHDESTRSIVAAREVLPRRPQLLSRGPAYLLHFILDVLVDHYLPIVDKVAEEVDELEEAVFADDAKDIHPRIIRIKRGISALRRIVGPQRDTILALTRDEFRAIPAELRPYLRDVYDRLARVTDLLDSFRDEIATLLELHVSITSNRLNEIIKRLTVIATIALPLTVVTSYYGMNVKLPEFGWSHGAWFVGGLLALTALVTWLYLKFKRLG
jgi:magnesium transporter